MKELLTKNFWRGVKKTYDDARNGPPADDTALLPPAEGEQAPETPSPPSPASEQH
jgi:hypothetical protein